MQVTSATQHMAGTAPSSLLLRKVCCKWVRSYCEEALKILFLLLILVLSSGTKHISPYNMLFFNIFIYLFLVVLGLCCCTWAFSSCGEWGLLSSWSARVSHCGGFSCCGAQAQLLCSMWNPSRPGIRLISPALAGGFLLTVPPGKSLVYYLTANFCSHLRSWGLGLIVKPLSFGHIMRIICSADSISSLQLKPELSCPWRQAITIHHWIFPLKSLYPLFTLRA